MRLFHITSRAAGCNGSLYVETVWPGHNRDAPSGDVTALVLRRGRPGGRSVVGRAGAGSVVVHRTTTENENNKTEKTVTTIVYALKQKTDDFIVVESQATTVHYTGRVETNPPSETKTRKTFSLPPGAKRPEPKKAEEGTEELTVAGKRYKATWTREKSSTEAGDLFAQTWSSAEIPGGLLKSVSKVPSKKATITVEVTEVVIP